MITVATNGVFAFIHAGHVNCLKRARMLGDRLVVGINDCESASILKGRTIPSDEERSLVLKELRCVDCVTVFHGTTAIEFLKDVHPDIYVKGGDYSIETLHPDERNILESIGTKIVILSEEFTIHCSSLL